MPRAASLKITSVGGSLAVIPGGGFLNQTNLTPGKHMTLRSFGEELAGLADCCRRWRFNHVATAETVIGFRRGAGGTSRMEYLHRTPGVELFSEPWRLRRGNPEPWA